MFSTIKPIGVVYTGLLCPLGEVEFGEDPGSGSAPGLDDAVGRPDGFGMPFGAPIGLELC